MWCFNLRVLLRLSFSVQFRACSHILDFGFQDGRFTFFPWLWSGFSIANQIKFDLRLTWCSELIVDQLCLVFPCIFNLQLRDRRLADWLSTEPTLCQSDWLTVTSICGVVLNYPACAASGVDAIASKGRHVCCQKYVLSQVNTGASIHFISSENIIHSINWSVVIDRHATLF